MTRARRRAIRAKLFVLMVALLVSLGAAMPAWARLAAGPQAHNCKCEVRGGHAHCACPLCFPELREEDDFGSPTVSGRCGTDDPGWKTLASPAILLPGSFLVPALARLETVRPLALRLTQWSQRPELPPPRHALSPSFS